MSVPFLETPRFPDDLAVWGLGGVCFNTTVTGSTSGREQRNILWQFGRGRWDLQNTFRKNGKGATDPLSVQYLRNFFRYCKGQAYGFRFRDWTDYQDEGNGILGAPLANFTSAPSPTGYGNGTPTYQMYKAYAAAPLADYRLIQKPYQTSVLRNGVATTSGSLPGNANLDTTTGLVTFVADNNESVNSWNSGATTSLSVPTVPSNWTVGALLYFTGVIGDTNGVLNNQAVAITAISGTLVTVAANTTGGTLSSGVAYHYPQATEALTWTGTFDVPVRFATDQFAPQLDVGTGALYGFQTLQIVEIRV